jgi:hypothetical protein
MHWSNQESVHFEQRVSPQNTLSSWPRPPANVSAQLPTKPEKGCGKLCMEMRSLHVLKRKPLCDFLTAARPNTLLHLRWRLPGIPRMHKN